MTSIPDDTGLLYSGMTAPLTACADGTWCCGFSSASIGDCCSSRKGVTIIDGKVVTPQGNTSTSLNVPKPSATTAQTLSPSPNVSSVVATTSPSSPKAASSNAGSIVGEAVGGCAGMIALAFVLWYFVIRRKMKQRSAPPHHRSHQVGKKGLWQVPEELSTQEARVELDSRRARQELEDRAIHELRTRESSILSQTR